MSRFEEEYNIRLKKLNKAQKKGINPYPARVNRSHEIKNVLHDFKALVKTNIEISIVGRTKSIRLHGGSCFANIVDGTEQIQIFVKKDKIGQENYNNFKELVDIGDFIQIKGTAFKTKKGESTILVDDFRLISKSLMPLPEKWHGLSDVEIRYRKRYLDLISNDQVKNIFKKRALIIKNIRDFLDANNFLEVETPVLQSIPGGANAKPFVTHHNALNINLFLRIAPELYLKQLITGGFEKVYEIARCFRNEGIDKNHNPEFTQVEFYAAYWDYEKMMEFTEQLFLQIIKNIFKSNEIIYDKQPITFKIPFTKITFTEACKKYANINISKVNDTELSQAAKKKGLDIDKSFHRAKILDEIFKELIRPNIIQPTFIVDYPKELSPLAKTKPENKTLAERFQLLVGGIELCNAFSEINNPLDQKERFIQQEKNRQAGDDEAQHVDKNFIEALSHGMPPAAGIGIGIDRLTALLCNVNNIKEVILFPTLKPK